MPRLTTTERNWIVAVTLALLVGGLMAAWRAIEHVAAPAIAGRWPVVESPSEAAARFLGVSHFLVAFLFLGTSRRLRSPRTAGYFAALTAIAIGLCSLFVFVRQSAPGFAMALVFGYFLLHDFRDQIFFYRANGDLSREDERPGLDASLLRVPLVIFGSLAAVAALLFACGWISARHVAEDAVARFVSGHRWLLAASVIGAAGLIGASARRRWTSSGLGPGTLWRRYRPVIVVLVAASAFAIGAAVMTGKAQWIVSLHVTAWYVFTVAQFQRRSGAAAVPRRGTWPWWRGSLAGFQTLHIGAFVVLLVLAAVWSYGLHRSPSSALAVMLSSRAFPLWTITHITLSFTPR